MSSQGSGFAARKASRAWSPKLQRRMSAKAVVEAFARQRIGEAEGDEAAHLSSFWTTTPFPSAPVSLSCGIGSPLMDKAVKIPRSESYDSP